MLQWAASLHAARPSEEKVRPHPNHSPNPSPIPNPCPTPTPTTTTTPTPTTTPNPTPNPHQERAVVDSVLAQGWIDLPKEDEKGGGTLASK